MSAEAAAEALSSASELGHYRVTVEPLVSPIPLNQFHDWRLRVETPSGRRFDPKQLTVYGGMEGHGHGLPATPQVTERLAAGEYRIGGLRFNMAGDWQLFVGVNGPAGPDKARIEVAVGGLSQDRTVQPVLGFTHSEVARLTTLRLRPVAGRQSGNRLANNASAVRLGQRLFNDVRLSGSANIACVSCHVPEFAFTDQRRVSVGATKLTRNSPSLLGIASADWFYWDGRRDSLWAQALTPIETRAEMDSTRTQVARLLLTDVSYRSVYASIAAGALPDSRAWPDAAGPFGDEDEKVAWQQLAANKRRDIDTVFADAGKALAAYVATLAHKPTRFDRFAHAMAKGDEAAAERWLTVDERAGLKLFLDEPRSKCIRCHNGPQLTNFGFHNIGTATNADGQFDFGRALGVRAAAHDPFNCLGAYSDAAPSECSHHRFAESGHAPIGAFKVPSLRDLVRTAPYMHDGRFRTLEAVIAFYRATVPAADNSDDRFRLEISDSEARQLALFLRTLSAEPRAAAHHH